MPYQFPALRLKWILIQYLTEKSIVSHVVVKRELSFVSIILILRNLGCLLLLSDDDSYILKNYIRPYCQNYNINI